MSSTQRVAVTSYGHAGRLHVDRFPRASKYSQAWQTQFFMGPNPLWLAEFALQACPVRPGLKILDLGCGAGTSSAFIAKEYDAKVYAVDRIMNSDQVSHLARSCGVQNHVIPVEADANELPFPHRSFDIIVALGGYSLYAANDHYLPYISQFLVPGGKMAVVESGHLRESGRSDTGRRFTMWDGELVEEHPLDWWQRLWHECPDVELEVADHLPRGWRNWLAWDELWLEIGDFSTAVDVWRKALSGRRGEISGQFMSTAEVNEAMRHGLGIECEQLRRDRGRTMAITRLVAQR